MKFFNTTQEGEYTKLYDEHWTKALAYAMLRCNNNRMLAEDIVQDVFMKLWMKKDALKKINQLSSYLFIMVRNEVVNYQRRQKLEQRLQYDCSRDQQNNITHDQLLEKEYRATLQKAINRLPPQQKLVYELRCEYNWKNEKIARVLALSPNTVKNHIQDARKRLREMVA